MEKHKSLTNKIMVLFNQMTRSTKIIIIIFIIIILSLSLLILRNYIFKEDANYLKEEKIKLLDEELRAEAALRNEITKKQLEKEDLDLIEKIAAVEELRNPFLPAQNKEQQTSAEKESLLYSESELRADNELKNAANGIKKNKSDQNTSKKNELEEENSQQQLIEIKIPFSLLGIIRDDNSSAALFSYQGSIISKLEGESIENFQVEKIKKETVVLSYNDFKYSQYIWRHDQIEEN